MSLILTSVLAVTMTATSISPTATVVSISPTPTTTSTPVIWTYDPMCHEQYDKGFDEGYKIGRKNGYTIGYLAGDKDRWCIDSCQLIKYFDDKDSIPASNLLKKTMKREKCVCEKGNRGSN